MDKKLASEPTDTNRWVTRQREELTALIDWCQITVKNAILHNIIEDILRIPFDLMEPVTGGKGISGHELVAGFDNIKVLKPTGDTQYNGYQILMSGTACRNYEHFLALNKETWFDFLKRVCKYNVNFPRIDLAIDDRKPYLRIPELIQLTKKGLLSSQLRTVTSYTAGELSEETLVNKGDTLYLGSPQSDFRLVFYEKGYEQAEKYGKELDTNWNRYELRFRHERADKVVQELVSCRNVSQVALQVLNEKIRFLQQPQNSTVTRKRLYPTYEPWAVFMDNVKKLKLIIEPQEKTLDKIWNWLYFQVAPTLKLVSEIGQLDGTDYISFLIRESTMNPTQQRLYDEYKKTILLRKRKGGMQWKTAFTLNKEKLP